MGNFQRDIKRMVEEVTVPTDKLDATVNAALKIAKNKEWSAASKRQNYLAGVASIFLLAIGSLLISMFLLGSATNQASESIFYKLGDAGLKRMVEEGRVTDLSLEVFDQEIKVTLEEGYLDNNQLAISYHIEMEQDLENVLFELFFDGSSVHHVSSRSGSSSMPQSDIFYFEPTKSFPDHPELKLQFHQINQVQGDWSFSFDLKKEMELYEVTNYAIKEDHNGQLFSVDNIIQTPSMMQLSTTTKLLVDEVSDGFRAQRISIVAVADNGDYVLADFSRSSNTEDGYGFNHFPNKLREMVKVQRGIASNSYKIVPYFVTYKGQEFRSDHSTGYIWDEIGAPFKKGAVLEMASPIKIVEIESDKEQTIVYYEMDATLPVFPVIIDRDTKVEYGAISYNRQGTKVAVTYPKVPGKNSIELFMYDATYQVFPDLEIEIELK
ncbi:DUF4179 domain-containing protein [Anaerobacillus sp. CMMVII]|uniref:DUF4179 domain-containing protein n=1 Tax=Anaerobacillus sp. CMMVII TaxID=2755588 RepID=UPI0021B7071F|nr:DUF4179 domain-containing protein [Anaerobacillus sp. CMMVII]MCT8139397.1 DUF4179 domain-containing protein [Anaerobacillus sp. CMMVII]